MGDLAAGGQHYVPEVGCPPDGFFRFSSECCPLGKLTESDGILILITPQWKDAACWGEVIALSTDHPVLLPLPSLWQQKSRELWQLQLLAW